MAELTGRETEILEALVRLSETPDCSTFSILPGADKLEMPDWPEGNAAPTRDEVRGLVGRDLLEIDKSKAPTWCFWPSEQARAIFAWPIRASVGPGSQASRPTARGDS